MGNFISLGQKITAERERLGLTQAQLGERTGVSREQIGKYERDRNAPGAKFLEAFAALGVNLDSLMERSGAMAAHEAKPAVYALLKPAVVREAVQQVAQWCVDHELTLTPQQMAEAVMILCESAADVAMVERQAKSMLPMLRLVG